jgi:eukaryotic-like serine/threonine-protein kinase
MKSDPFGIVGTVVEGRYRVERVAGQGGFGVVYRAQHLGFAAPIALKVLKLPEHWTRERRDARLASFQREGRMLFELSALHPSIVRAFETGTIDTPDGARAPYLALEWLDGVSLDEELKHRRKHALAPMTLGEVLKLLDAPAEGLARAHARSVVHRDVKPGNLFVSVRDGEPTLKILDFGIAKIVDEAADTTTQYAVTSGATASFTPMYAAPEQWLERLGATGAWTDVHALALVCVELLTGALPLKGHEPAQFMAACLDPSERPTPRNRGFVLHPNVEAVFARGVTIDPRERYRDVGAFWRALREAAESASVVPAERVEIFCLGDGAANAVEPHAGTPAFVSSPSTTAATASFVAPRARGALTHGGVFRWLAYAAAVFSVAAVVVVARKWSERERSREVAAATSTPTLRARVAPALGSTKPAALDQHVPGVTMVPVTGAPADELTRKSSRSGPQSAVDKSSPRAIAPVRSAAPALPAANAAMATGVNLDDPGLVRRR